MSIWRPVGVADEPKTRLVRWSAYEVAHETGATVHFVGTTSDRYPEGRVSSPIKSFDKETCIGISRSGRQYQLVGETERPGRDATYTFNAWLNVNGNPKIEDVSSKYSGT